MRYLFFSLLFLLSCCQPNNMPEQITQQITQQANLSKSLKSNAIRPTQMRIYLRAFKEEGGLEVWAANDGEAFKLIQSYAFCVNSGTLGPKRKEGDLQIPEGCYHIDRFNPKSKFHLSLGINYPNAADLVHADPSQPGSNIFIHGGCASIGCISITDPKIEEVYGLCEQAKSNGQTQIPVHIFPFRMTNENVNDHLACEEFEQQEVLWKELTSVYQAFEPNSKVPVVRIIDGSYML
jgi:murein L,D-transpeptidase YafK